MDDFIDIIRREVANAFANRQHKLTLAVTSYDPDKYAIKGIILPSKVESGWMPIATDSIGNDYGLVIGPKVGSAEKLDGDQFDVEFEGGDQSTPVATRRKFSKQDKPPRVESGEVMLKREDGGYVKMNKDGEIEIRHKGGGFVKIDKDGNHEHNTNNKNIVIKAGTGTSNIEAQTHNFKGPVNVEGAVTSTELVSAPVLNGAHSH